MLLKGNTYILQRQSYCPALLPVNHPRFQKCAVQVLDKPRGS